VMKGDLIHELGVESWKSGGFVDVRYRGFGVGG